MNALLVIITFRLLLFSMAKAVDYDSWDEERHGNSYSRNVYTNAVMTKNNLTVTVTMLSRKRARVTWWPYDAFMDKDFQINYAPERANYKVVMSLSDPVGNSVDLIDLRPYTNYRLDLRTKANNFKLSNKNHSFPLASWIGSKKSEDHILISLNFSTSEMNPHEVTIYYPTGFSQVQADEIFIVVMVLFVWAGAVYIFFNQWGKIRGIIPYQPAFRKYEVVMDGNFEPEEVTCPQCDNNQIHLCRKAMTFDELMAARGVVPGLVRSRNNSAIFIHYASLPGDDSSGDQDILHQSGLRKTKSAESVLCMIKRPRIVLQDSMERTKEVLEDGDQDEEDTDGDLDHDKLIQEEVPIRTNESSSQDSYHHLLPPPTSGVRGRYLTSSLSEDPESPFPPSSSVHRNFPSLGDIPETVFDTSDPTSPRKITIADVITPVIRTRNQRKVVQASKNAFLQAIRHPSSASKVASPPSPSFMSMDTSPKAQIRAANPSPIFTYSSEHGGMPSHPTSPYIVRRQQTAASGGLRRQQSIVENTIPLTTTFVNRMAKRNLTQQSSVSSVMSAQGQGQPLMQGRVSKAGSSLAGDSTECYKRKVLHISTDSNDSNKSSSQGLMSSPYYAAKQRVGSFRSRLKKQNPIFIWESDCSTHESHEVSNPSSKQQTIVSTSGTLPSTEETYVELQSSHQEAKAGGASLARHKRWSVSSETDAKRQNQFFWRFGSTTNVLKSNSSSKDSKDVSEVQEQRRCSSCEVDIVPETSNVKDIYLSVPYKIINEQDM